MLSPPVTIGSLFSGIGGLESGLEHATGARTLWQVERESFCRDVLARHWPDAVRYDDVRTVGAELAPVDVICGGFPCQDVSLAGKRAGFAGERSSLWREYRRLVALLQPRFVFAENVPGLLTARGGRDFAEVLGDLAALGFDAEWATFRASDVGAPHKRERLFVLAYRDGDRRDAGRLPLGALAAQSVARVAGPDGLADAGRPPPGQRESQRLPGGAVQAVAFGARPNGSGVGLADSDGARLPQREDRARHPGEDERATAQRGGLRGGDGRSGGGAVTGMGHGADGLPAGVARRDPDAHRWPAGRGEAQHEGEPARTSKHVPQRAAKLKALGNAVVRQQAALAWRVLYARACSEPGVREAGSVSQMTLAGVA
mgnify:FL=1